MNDEIRMTNDEGMRKIVSLCWLMIVFMTPVGLASAAQRDVEVLLVVGAPGTEEYGQRFEKQVTAWKSACEKAAVQVSVIGKDDKDAVSLETALKKAAAKPAGQFWLVLIGHGTFDNREVKFNLRGPDVSAKQLAEWLKPVQRELVVIHTASASAGFMAPLAGKNRVLVSATKSADEIYYAHFGEYFAPAIAGLAEADLDQDKQVSVLEAFLYASKKSAEFYEKEERLATEHALIEDNGDGVGTRSEMFEGVKAKDAKADGARSAQIALVLSDEEMKLSDAQRVKRDELERKLETLKAMRAEMKEDVYYSELEALMRQLSAVYSSD